MSKFEPFFDNYWNFPGRGDWEFMTPTIGFSFVSKDEKSFASWVFFFCIGFWVFGIMYNSYKRGEDRNEAND